MVSVEPLRIMAAGLNTDRIAVAMTRPKRHLCVIGDSETVGRYVSVLSQIVVQTLFRTSFRGLQARGWGDIQSYTASTLPRSGDEV